MLSRILIAGRACASALLGFAALLTIATQASALPVVCEPPRCATWSEESGGNGNRYAFITLTPDVTWTAAKALAEISRLSDGSVGSLVSISSAEEQAFVQSQVLPSNHVGVNRNQVWIGGNQDPNQAPDAGWKWIVNPEITPESWDYANWTDPSEPNDDGGRIDERFLTMWVHYYQRGVGDLRGKWNDEQNQASSAARIIGMLVEWSAPSVPEPGTSALAALAFGLLALRRFRRC